MSTTSHYHHHSAASALAEAPTSPLPQLSEKPTALRGPKLPLPPLGPRPQLPKKSTALLSVSIPGGKRAAKSAPIELSSDRSSALAIGPSAKKAAFSFSRTFDAGVGTPVGVALAAALASEEDRGDSEVRAYSVGE
jgi:hypothetical protein